MTDIRFLSGQRFGAIVVDNMGDPDDPRKEDRLNAMIDIERMLDRFHVNERIFLLLYGQIGVNATFKMYTVMLWAHLVEQPSGVKVLPCWQTCLCGRKATRGGKCFLEISNRKQHDRGSKVVEQLQRMLEKEQYIEENSPLDWKTDRIELLRELFGPMILKIFVERKNMVMESAETSTTTGKRHKIRKLAWPDKNMVMESADFPITLA